ncbi:ankyrin repeat and MYND domain-containing protein 1-like isoform X2 [Plodia interpunctella]|uniref:ankyrin repeat and MYND domain-containing protein 1-like isoform X2 n=1 Tax=Plodia interpunctella TaxID=58824 RepID=UPI0023689B76|nr:ankyrin repeat and MYND domain-containing protein 1-like isoform X2 [Plodia interpunctella]
MTSPYLRLKTYADKSWPYDEYYFGEKDERDRKGGKGEHHWFGAKSIEWYRGSFLCDTMHGLGDYRWRYSGFDGVHSTYEGYFYSNEMHGYGTMSYPDGIVFTGLYSNNNRYGPGVETNFSHADVGLWRGMRLVRLAWRPGCCSIIPDLTQGELARKFVEPQRVLLASNSITIGEINSALDLLKQNGCDPQQAMEKWMKLYPQHCTDQASKLCDVKHFQRDYYQGAIQELVVIDALPPPKEIEMIQDLDQTVVSDANFYYYAWNNEDLMIDMMKHCYKHEEQRVGQEMSVVDMLCIMSGHRKAFKPPGKYEVDSRTLLMASFLGDIETVTQLINDGDICPGVTDNKGNSPVMYATFGDQTDIIHFLVEAGANVDSYNDSCCTPLGMAILRYLFTEKDVTPSEMIQALSPPVSPRPPISDEVEVDEWNISRDAIFQHTAGLVKSPSKLIKSTRKSVQSLKEAPKKKQDQSMLQGIPEVVSTESISDDKQVYNRINVQYVSAINDLFVRPSITNAVTYIFEINDMTIGIDIDEELPKKQDKTNLKKATSKVLKQTTKPSKEAMYRSSEKDISSIDEVDKLKTDTLSKIMFTILQLLSDGANPTLVKTPQPALLMAVIAGCPDLVLELVLHGANVNETYPHMFGYTPLDIAISKPLLTPNIWDLVRTLLECGSETNHRLQFLNQDEDIPGPTLLHVMLAKKTDIDTEVEIQQNILELLLQYRCDPTAQFKGRSAVDIAMSKGALLQDIFIESPNTDLNAIINMSNQTILVKMFSFPFFKTANPTERLQTITNLLLFGADPLIECQDKEEKYENIFVYMKKTLTELETASAKPSVAIGKPDPKAKPQKEKPEKAQKEKPDKSLKEKPEKSGMLKTGADGDYKQAQELMTDCARMLYIRWLQAKLMKELVYVIDKYQHRQWNMILREHKERDKKCVGLWLTPERCLEIWDILKTTRRKMYKNNRVLKHLLCMVLLYNKRFKDNFKEAKLSASTKNGIEADVAIILRDYTSGDKLEGNVPMKRPYVKPELTSKAFHRKSLTCVSSASFPIKKIQLNADGAS